MTDAHCHVPCGDPAVREFLIGRDFVGVHPWETLTDDPTSVETSLASVAARLSAEAELGVGEIGLDRLKCRAVPPLMREVFERQLARAVQERRRLVLHGAKCWGQIVAALKTAQSVSGVAALPRFLCHGFSRSDGLVPEIVALGGFVSVGPAILNDHAVNYRVLARKIPLDRLLVETDRTLPPAESPSVGEVLAKLAEVLGMSIDQLEARTDENADAFSR